MLSPLNYYRTFECQLCLKSFLSSRLECHVDDHSNEKDFSCDLCNQVFSKKKYLNDHKLIHRNKNKYTCDTCGKKFSLLVALQTHIQFHERDELLPYTASYTASPTVHYLKKQLISHENIEQERSQINAVLKEYSEKDEIFCKMCQSTFPTAKELYLQKKNSLCDRIFPCKICDINFSSALMLSNHRIACSLRNRPHGLKPIARNYSFQEPKQTHPKKVIYLCPSCKLHFKNQEDLQSHMLIHLGVNPFTCGLCFLPFSTDEELLIHRKVCGNPTFKCKICFKTYRSEKILKGHELIHTANHQGIPCETCNVTFKSRASLYSHVLAIHRFSCEICGATFSMELFLNAHIEMYHIQKLIPNNDEEKLLPRKCPDAKTCDSYSANFPIKIGQKEAAMDDYIVDLKYISKVHKRVNSQEAAKKKPYVNHQKQIRNNVNIFDYSAELLRKSDTISMKVEMCNLAVEKEVAKAV